MNTEQKNYIPVDLSTLEVGMLLERPLYVYFSGSQKHIRLVSALQPLEERIFEKLQKVGAVFSTEPALSDRFPDLVGRGNFTRTLCDNRELAPFEKNFELRKLTSWLVPFVFGPSVDLHAPLFFFHRAFGAPAAETLQYVSDLSVDMCGRSLKVSTLAGVLALWLGYSDTEFLRQFATSVFCEEVGRYANSGFVDEAAAARPASAEELAETATMLVSGQVPGIAEMDDRFRLLLSAREQLASAGDELKDVVEYARKLWAMPTVTSGADTTRIARKLKKFLLEKPAGKMAPAAAGKAAA